MAEKTTATFAEVFEDMDESEMGKQPWPSQTAHRSSNFNADRIYLEAFDNLDNSRRILEKKGCSFEPVTAKGARLCMYYGIAKLAGIHHGREKLHPYLIGLVKEEFDTTYDE